MTTFDKIFNFLGLSNRAKMIYELLTGRGQMTASAIAQELNTPRSTIYLELENLRNLNLIAISGSGGKRRFVAENPNILMEKIKEKSKEVEDLLPMAQKIITEQQEKIQKASWYIPQINFFQGIEGIKKVLKETNTARSKEVLGLVSVFDIYEAVGENFLKELVEERVKRGVKVRNIWPKNKVPKVFSKHKEQLREVRFSSEHLSLPSTILTFDNKVIIITSTKELFCVEITSHDLAQAIKILFQMLWKRAEENK